MMGTGWEFKLEWTSYIEKKLNELFGNMFVNMFVESGKYKIHFNLYDHDHFNGDLDGDGPSIYNLHINRVHSSPAVLIGIGSEEGKIKNLKLKLFY